MRGETMLANPDLDVYEDADWSAYRTASQDRLEWFDGTNLRVRITGAARDPFTKDVAELWPLRINPIARFCYAHQATMLGVIPEVSELPVQTLVSRVGLPETEQDTVDDLEAFLRLTWERSAGISTQSLGALRMQYYGGHAYQVAWKPYDRHLPHRIEVISHDSPAHIWPVAWATNKTRLLECYIGYKITAAEAGLKFGVKTDDEEVLYMEHWTEKDFWIHVDGKTPRLETGNGTKVPMAGENPWGRVPVVYIPHFPREEFWGSSLVDGPQDLTGLSKELNSRMADKGDSMQEAVPFLVAKNADQGFNVRRIMRGGQVIREVLDLGSKKPMPSAGDPDIWPVEGKGMPDAASKYTGELWDTLLIQGQVASVALGMDDVSGGRITGPVTAYRMLPTLHHTGNERIDFSQGLITLAETILAVARAKVEKEAYKTLNVTPPSLPDFEPSFQCKWRPTIPIEDEKQILQLNERLKVGGISLQSYLIELGCPDPSREMERIWEEREREVELQTRAQAAAFMNRPQQEQANA